MIRDWPSVAIYTYRHSSLLNGDASAIDDQHPMNRLYLNWKKKMKKKQKTRNLQILI